MSSFWAVTQRSPPHNQSSPTWYTTEHNSSNCNAGIWPCFYFVFFLQVTLILSFLWNNLPNVSLWQQKSFMSFKKGTFFVLIFQLFMALEALSTVDVIHTDIKLDNIMLVKWYDLRIKVIDFGLAILGSNANVGRKLQAIKYRWNSFKNCLLFAVWVLNFAPCLPLQGSRNFARPALHERHWYVERWLRPRPSLRSNQPFWCSQWIWNGILKILDQCTSPRSTLSICFCRAGEAGGAAPGSARGLSAPCWHIHREILHSGRTSWWSNVEAEGTTICSSVSGPIIYFNWLKWLKCPKFYTWFKEST